MPRDGNLTAGASGRQTAYKLCSIIIIAYYSPFVKYDFKVFGIMILALLNNTLYLSNFVRPCHVCAGAFLFCQYKTGGYANGSFN